MILEESMLNILHLALEYSVTKLIFAHFQQKINLLRHLSLSKWISFAEMAQKARYIFAI